jgi:hypothetical protein
MCKACGLIHQTWPTTRKNVLTCTFDTDNGVNIAEKFHHAFSLRKDMRMLWGTSMRKAISGFFLFILLTACSNDSLFEGIAESSGYDAKIEDAAIALDNSDYDKAISDLAVIYDTTALKPEVGRLLSSAYMGKAWVDLTYFIANSTSTGINPFDAIASALSSPDISTGTVEGGTSRYIAKEVVGDLIQNINNARSILYTFHKKNLATDDDTIKLGIASSIHFIMYVGDKTDWMFGQNPINPFVPINMRAYRYYQLERILPSAIAYSEPPPITPYQQDLIDINNAVIAFSHANPKPNDMRNTLNAFLYSVLGVGTDVPVTDELIIATCTSTGIWTYVQSLAQGT